MPTIGPDTELTCLPDEPDVQAKPRRGRKLPSPARCRARTAAADIGVDREHARRRGRGGVQPMAPEARYGLIGDAVAELEPHTEADPHGLLLQLLAYFGNRI